MNTTQSMIIKHCIKCDATKDGNHFQEWLKILRAGSKVSIHDTQPHFDLEYIQEGLDCPTCRKNEIQETVIMVVFKWVTEE